MFFKIRQLFFISFICHLLLACNIQSKDEIKLNIQTSDEFTSRSYYPLFQENEWFYEGTSDSCTISVTGKSTINNIEYIIVYNSLEETTSSIRYEDGKYYALIETQTNEQEENTELLFLDENASSGDLWKIEHSVSYNEGVKTTKTYDVNVSNWYANKTVNDTEYEDVIEITTTESTDYHLSDQLSQAGVSLEELGYINTKTKTSICYARGVGMIVRTSKKDSLELDLNRSRLME